MRQATERVRMSANLVFSIGGIGMPEPYIPTRTAKQSACLEAALADFGKLMTRRVDAPPATELVPRIRANLKQAGVDASALNLGGNCSAEEIEQLLDRRLSEVTDTRRGAEPAGQRTR